MTELECKKIINNLIEITYEEEVNSFYSYYDTNSKNKSGFLIDNDAGDIIPFLDYFGYEELVTKYVNGMLDKYKGFYIDKSATMRFGATPLTKYNVCDLYSNSDYLHGLLFIRNLDRYKELHSKIDEVVTNIFNNVIPTKNTMFLKLFNKFIPLPIYRLLDDSMFAELMYKFGYESSGEQRLENVLNRIFSKNAPLKYGYVMGISILDRSYLMKDHTNFIYSLIGINNENSKYVLQIKKLFTIIDDYFVKDNIIFNSTKEIDNKYFSSLFFTYIDCLLEAYLSTKDDYYKEKIKYFLDNLVVKILKKHDVIPDKMDVNFEKSSDFSTLDPNTDLYVTLKKINLVFGNEYISLKLLDLFRNNIINTFYNKEGVLYTLFNITNKKPVNNAKTKFSFLFFKIYIIDQINTVDEMKKYQDYLDDR